MFTITLKCTTQALIHLKLNKNIRRCRQVCVLTGQDKSRVFGTNRKDKVNIDLYSKQLCNLELR